jgi:DNA (cytosine-5)-methyltransferase 1
MKRGKLLESFLLSLEDEGYATQTFLLKAEQYGVPQRRRRVVILGNRNGLSVEGPKTNLAPIARGKTRHDAHVANNELPPPVTVSEAISDLPVISAGEGQDVSKYNPEWIDSDYQRLMREMITLEEFFSKRTEQG